MGNSTDPTADTAGHANGGDIPTNAGAGDIDAKINRAISNWMKRLEAKIPQLVESKIEAMVQQEPAPSATQDTGKRGNADADDPNRLSLKALQNQITELTTQLKKRDEALEQEKARVVDSQMRGEVREALAGALGADNPNLSLVMDSLYDARKRFARDESGQTLVRFNAGYGADDELLPLKDGLKKLVDGELKHMLPAKTNTLPVVGRGRNGTPLSANGAGKPTNVVDHLMSGIVNQIAGAAAADPTQK